jgi:predicted RNase H-like nuclease
MRAVLGIDAAWTTSQPSGVALAVEGSSGWELVAVESSYQRFHSLACDSVERESRPSGSIPAASELLRTSFSLCGRHVDLVAVDMPLSAKPITGRRESDNAVSRAYGGRKCSTHTPSESRPGKMSDRLRGEFKRMGYPLQTTSITTPGLVEVYPHPALVELARAPERFPYKLSKVRKYWPELSPAERRVRLYSEWDRIIALLQGELRGVASFFRHFNLSGSGVEVKAYEDALDAVICTWIAIKILEGQAEPFGDSESAIWIPRT